MFLLTLIGRFAVEIFKRVVSIRQSDMVFCELLKRDKTFCCVIRRLLLNIKSDCVHEPRREVCSACAAFPNPVDITSS